MNASPNKFPGNSSRDDHHRLLAPLVASQVWYPSTNDGETPEESSGGDHLPPYALELDPFHVVAVFPKLSSKLRRVAHHDNNLDGDTAAIKDQLKGSAIALKVSRTSMGIAATLGDA